MTLTVQVTEPQNLKLKPDTCGAAKRNLNNLQICHCVQNPPSCLVLVDQLFQSFSFGLQGSSCLDSAVEHEHKLFTQAVSIRFIWVWTVVSLRWHLLKWNKKKIKPAEALLFALWSFFFTVAATSASQGGRVSGREPEPPAFDLKPVSLLSTDCIYVDQRGDCGKSNKARQETCLFLIPPLAAAASAFQSSHLNLSF